MKVASTVPNGRDRLVIISLDPTTENSLGKTILYYNSKIFNFIAENCRVRFNIHFHIERLKNMLSTLDKPADQLSETILCWYINITSQVQVIRISNIPNWYFERTVFPGERFIFESFAQAELEIYQKDQNNTIFCQQQRCCELQVEENKDS